MFCQHQKRVVRKTRKQRKEKKKESRKHVHDRLKLVISPLDIKGTATILIDELIVILTSPWGDDPSALRIPLLASCKIQAVVLAHGSMGAPLDKDAGG